MCVAFRLFSFDCAGFCRRCICGKSKQGSDNCFMRHSQDLSYTQVYNGARTQLFQARKQSRGIKSPETC